jgi:hypothetical protein
MVQVICAWCGKNMGQKPGPDGKVSHGMCPACRENAQKEMDAYFERERKRQAAS